MATFLAAFAVLLAVAALTGSVTVAIVVSTVFVFLVRLNYLPRATLERAHRIEPPNLPGGDLAAFIVLVAMIILGAWLQFSPSATGAPTIDMAITIVGLVGILVLLHRERTRRS